MKFDCFAERIAIGKRLDEAAIIGSQKVLKNKARKELMLRKLLGAVLVAMSWQRRSRDLQRSQQNGLR